jgi:hypothetical protein
MLLNGLAWAMIITGAVMEYKNAQGEGGIAFTVALMLPGAIVIIITQVMWTGFRMEHGLVVKRPDPPPPPPDFPDDMPDDDEDVEEDAESRQARLRRRSQRRRTPRSGRSSR